MGWSQTLPNCVFDTNNAQQIPTNTAKKETKNTYKTSSVPLSEHTHRPTQHSSCSPSLTPPFLLSKVSDLSPTLSLSLSLNGLRYRNFIFHDLLQGEPGNEISIFVLFPFSFMIRSVRLLSDLWWIFLYPVAVFFNQRWLWFFLVVQIFIF